MCSFYLQNVVPFVFSWIVSQFHLIFQNLFSWLGAWGDGGREEESMHNHLHAIIIYKMPSSLLELTRIRVERYAVSEIHMINIFRNCKSTGRRQWI